MLLLSGNLASAQGMMEVSNNTDDHTAREEAEGKAVWEKLQAKQTTCADLSDDDFGALGEYFMGQMMGDSHEAMNNMMIRVMGEEGEGQMHVVMGKRLSGCDPAAAYPAQGFGFMPIMQMMMGEWSSPDDFNKSYNSMMNFGNMGFGWFGSLFMILWWVLILVAIVALVKWLIGQGKQDTTGKTALDILKERYAKGEINKQEYEEKKKDLI